ncbi:zinc finger protein 831 [Mantella aurantiaca]
MCCTTENLLQWQYEKKLRVNVAQAVVCRNQKCLDTDGNHCTESELFDMDASNISSLPSSVVWPTSTAICSDFHTAKESTVNDRSSAQAVLIKGVCLPVYQIAQQECQNLPFQLTSPAANFGIDSGNLSVVLAPQTQTVLQKSLTQTLTLNIVNPLTVFGTSPSKTKNIGKHRCSHCGRDCLKPSVLEKHIRSHTGERPFPCTICGISFKTQSNLYKHRRTQTHVNNAKQSFDSDCIGCQEDQNTEQAGGKQGLNIHKAGSDICTDNDQCSGNNSVDRRNLVHENTSLPLLVNKDILSFLNNHDQVIGEPACASPTKDSMFILNQKRSLKDQRSLTTNRHAQLQKQSETCIDKLLNCSSSQRKLKKCESTDSGYLSHSDSSDLQMFSSSPLHSLSECSFESDAILNTTLDCEDKTSAKKNLEEHISMLISQNKVVVDNTHLDNVRPRKTTLSKQGSIDLPMPYTFKDSFHFDIKSLDANRKKVSMCSISSNITPIEKNKPMFFHSVPTQISSSIDNVILARSNSLPFVENGRVQDRFPVRNTKAHIQGKQPLNVTFANLLLSNTATACTVDFSSSHPRGLVRQAAVDEVQTSHISESPISEENKEVKKLEEDQLTPKSKSANRKAGQKKVNMFSHEKWQMYGDETFKKFYQKIKKKEHTKKTKQEAQDSKCEDRSETILKTVIAKPLESISSPPLDIPPSSDSKFMSTSSKKCLFKTISVISKAREVTLPSENVQKVLDVDLESNTILRSGSDNEILINGESYKLKSHIPENVSDLQADCPQFHLLSQSNKSVVNSDNMGNTVSEKSSVVSNIPKNMSDGFNGCLGNHGQSSSDREKIKAAKKKEESLENTLEHSMSNETGEVKCLTQSKDLLVSNDAQHSIKMDFKRNTDIVAKKSLDRIKRCDLKSSCILNDKCLQTQSKDFGNRTEPFSIHSLPSSAELTSTQKEPLFSPRYLIKFHYIGPSVGVSSGLQADQDQKCHLPSEEPDLFRVAKCSDLKASYEQNTNNEETLIQKHDSVIVPFTKRSLIKECVSTGAATISIQVTQNVILNSKGRTDQKINLEDKPPTDENKIQELGVLTQLETSPYKECIPSELRCRDNATQNKSERNAIIYKSKLPGTTSQRSSEQLDTVRHEYKLASAIGKSSHDAGLETTNGLQAGLFFNTPVESILSPKQGSFPYNTAQLCWHSGICNMRVTKVTFSTLNTEPKSTWCWLDKCLPLPIEQKEKSFSVYASLNYNSIKDRRPVQAPLLHSGTVNKYQATSAGQLLAPSILLKSIKQKDCSEGIKQSDANKFQQSAKKSIRMGVQTKSRQRKRNKDSCRECPQSKVPHRAKHRGLRQNPRQKKTCPSSSLKSGDILQVTTSSGSGDHFDISILSHPHALQLGDKKEEGECGYGMDSYIDERTSTKIASVPLFASDPKLIAGEKHKSRLTEEFASLKFPQKTSLSWQKSCNLPTDKDETTSDQITPEIKRVHLQQDLVDGPPQKHGRKILRRSKTIGHSMGEETTGPNHTLALHNSSLPLLANIDLQANVPTDSVQFVRSPTLQNSRKSVIGGCGPSDHNLDAKTSGKALDSGELSMGRNISSQNQCRASDLEQTSLKFQKKVNLEVMRKQTHVEYSDTSSDDEDRLYIEIEKE